MKESEAIKKAIRHFECMKNGAVVVLDSGFGTHQGESDFVYRNRKMYAELAIKALEKQIPKRPIKSKEQRIRYVKTYYCPTCNLDFTGFNIAKWCYHCGQKLDWSEEE